MPEEGKGVVLVAAGVFTREWMTPRGHQRTPTVGYAFVDGGVLGMRCRQTSDNRWKRGGWFSRGELTPKLGQQTSEVPLTGATHLPKWGTSGNDSSGMFMECVRNNDAVRHSLQLYLRIEMRYCNFGNCSFIVGDSVLLSMERNWERHRFECCNCFLKMSFTVFRTLCSG